MANILIETYIARFFFKYGMVVNRDAKHPMTWAERNEVYRRRGAAKAIRYNPRWERDLLEQNKGKVGRPFKYSDSMMSFIALWKATVGESYRDCWGYLGKAFGEDRAPDHTTVWRRTGNAMPVFEHDPQFTLKEGVLRVAVDSTGIANSNRGEWIRVRWNVKRGFFKLHVLVDLDTRRILAFALSDMNGGDAAHLPLLLNQLMKGCTGEGIPLKESVAKIVMDKIPRAGGTDPRQTLMDRWTGGDGTPDTVELVLNKDELNRVDSVLSEKLRRICNRLKKMGIHIELRGDAGYDARYVFTLLANLGITPIIRIRVNANAKSDGVGRARALAALEQLGGWGDCSNEEFNQMTKDERRLNQKRWKKDVRSGLRWIVEIVISAFKRVFGESVRALKPHTAIIEIATKIAAYNRNLDIRDAVVGAMRRPPDTGPPAAAWPWPEATAA